MIKSGRKNIVESGFPQIRSKLSVGTRTPKGSLLERILRRRLRKND